MESCPCHAPPHAHQLQEIIMLEWIVELLSSLPHGGGWA